MIPEGSSACRLAFDIAVHRDLQGLQGVEASVIGLIRKGHINHVLPSALKHNLPPSHNIGTCQASEVRPSPEVAANET